MSDSPWGTSGSSPDPSGDEPSSSVPPKTPPDFVKRRPARPPEPVPDWLKSDHGPDAEPPKDRDPVAVAAVVCGFVGIVFFGILMAIATAILAGAAGQRARRSGHTFELPYLAFGLAFVDGIVWFVIHYAVKVPIWVG